MYRVEARVVLLTAIDVDAESPKEAAKLAHESLLYMSLLDVDVLHTSVAINSVINHEEVNEQ